MATAAEQVEGQEAEEEEEAEGEEEPELAHVELARFLSRAREYESTVPEEVCRYYMLEGGVEIGQEPDQELILKMVSLATDHFVAAVVRDAGEFARLRNANRQCLRSRDVMLALQRRGLTGLCEEEPDPPRPPPPRPTQRRAPATKRQREKISEPGPEPPSKRHQQPLLHEGAVAGGSNKDSTAQAPPRDK